MLFRWLTWAVSGQPRYLLTSRPYRLEVPEGAQSLGAAPLEGRFQVFNETIESCLTVGGELTSGEFRSIVFLYDNFLPDEVKSIDRSLVSGMFRLGLQSYSNGLPEEVFSDGADLLSGIFRQGLITYNNPAEEAESTGGSLVSGSHGA